VAPRKNLRVAGITRCTRRTRRRISHPRPHASSPELPPPGRPGPLSAALKWRVPETVALHASGTFASAWKEEPALRPTRRSSWTSRERPTDRLVRSPLRDERQRRLRSQPRCDDAEAGDNCLSRNLSRTPPTLSRSQPISHDLTRPERTPANGFRRILSPETRVRIPVAVPEAPAKRGFLRPGGVGPGRRTRSPAF
jgi:hypothetical protein